MRLHANDPLGYRARVYLDGQQLADVVELDTDEGWVLAMARDDTGQHVVQNDAVVLERRYGVVAVEFAAP